MGDMGWIAVTVLAALAAGVLSGLGIGSAGLFVLYLTLVAGMEQTEAQGINLIFFLLSAGASLLFHYQQRHIPWKTVAFLVLCAIPGTLLGTRLVKLLDPTLIRRLFGGMLIITGGMTLLKKKKLKPNQTDGANPKE